MKLILATYAISPNMYKTLSQCVIIKKLITYFAFIFCTKSSKCSVFFKVFILQFYLFIFDCTGSSFLCKGFLSLQQVGAAL